MILIDSFHIHTGGGNTLLRELIVYLRENNLQFRIIIDERNVAIFEELKDHKPIICKTSFERHLILFRLRKVPFVSIFYFQGIPPIFNFFRQPAFCYFQNVTIFNSCLKKIYFSLTKRNIHTWLFQTNLTSELFKKFFPIKNWNIYPFFCDPRKLSIKTDNSEKKKIRFIYPTSNNVHKNNELLIEVFENSKYELLLTIPENIHNKEQRNNIKYIGFQPHKNLIGLIKGSDVIINASMNESFGLYLIEAALLEKPIISINLPYVHEIISTNILFDSKEDLKIILEKFDLNESAPSSCKVLDKRTELINLLYEKS